MRHLEPLYVSPHFPRVRALRPFVPIEGTSVTSEMAVLAVYLEMILLSPSPSAPGSNPPESLHSATSKMHSFKIVECFLSPATTSYNLYHLQPRCPQHPKGIHFYLPPVPSPQYFKRNLNSSMALHYIYKKPQLPDSGLQGAA